MENTPIRLGISTCPNDTFAFHALIHRLVDWRGLDFQIELLDIQQLNDRVLSSEFDVAKASFAATLSITDQVVVLPTGSALGFGVGPLLLASAPNTVPSSATQVALCPGQHTTAAMLFALFHSRTATVKHCVFSEIMPSLQRAEADFGVCIHEGRFTWQSQGLYLVEDLGEQWEAATSLPLPLGGLIARRSLADDTLQRVQAVIRDSLEHSLTDRQGALPTMRIHAQEFNDDVLMKHVDLYVNDWTRDLGDEGVAALKCLSEMAQKTGLTPTGTPPLEIFGGAVKW